MWFHLRAHREFEREGGGVSERGGAVVESIVGGLSNFYPTHSLQEYNVFVWGYMPGVHYQVHLTLFFYCMYMYIK